MRKPIVHVIAGPNGCGKTTYATEYLPTMAQCNLFVNADLIAAGLSPLSPSSVNIQAARLVLEKIHEFGDKNLTFSFETTLAGKTYLKIIRDLKLRGYEIHIHFLWLRSVQLSLDRIKYRVKKGGHDVPEIDVRRRYVKGIKNLIQLYQKLADSVTIINNSKQIPEIIAVGDSKQFEVYRIEEMERIFKIGKQED